MRKLLKTKALMFNMENGLNSCKLRWPKMWHVDEFVFLDRMFIEDGEMKI